MIADKASLTKPAHTHTQNKMARPPPVIQTGKDPATGAEWIVFEPGTVTIPLVDTMQPFIADYRGKGQG